MRAVNILLYSLSLLFPQAVFSASYHYFGAVTETSGVFDVLVPAGSTSIDGIIEYSDFAVQAGQAGPNDVQLIEVIVGGFCFAHQTDCDYLSAIAPLPTINSASVHFDGDGNVIGGQITAFVFSPTFSITFPVLFDFENNQMFVDALLSGTFTGATTIARVVPLPPAILLYASAMMGIAGMRRHILT